MSEPLAPWLTVILQCSVAGLSALIGAALGFSLGMLVADRAMNPQRRFYADRDDNPPPEGDIFEDRRL